jgi:hypothetical protein
MEINNSDIFIDDDNIMYEYENELYNYICNDQNNIDYNKIYYTDASNHKNNVYNLENIKLNETEKTLFIKLAGYGDYQISIYKVNKPNNFIEELMSKFFKIQMDKINSYLFRIKHLELVKNGICFDRAFEYEKIQKQSNQNKSFIPENFEQMCILLGLEIRSYSNIDCKYSNKVVIKNNIVLDISYTPINLYKLMVNAIFNHKYSDMINYKIIKDNGNFVLVIFEFTDSYYIIDYSMS